MLIAAMNPCPCGWFGDPVKECTDSFAQGMRYQNRIGGPLLDRIDIHVEVPRVDYEKLSSDRLGEPSAKIRDRVQALRERQGAFQPNQKCVTDMTRVFTPHGWVYLSAIKDLDDGIIVVRLFNA